ncbi:MAG: bifunctional phosphoglucose/phosphomannose isomerase [Nanoarchaeota archaeon]
MNAVKDFPDLCKKAVGYKTTLPEEYKDFNKVLVVGMGGSAISGNLVKDWLNPFSKIPIDVYRGYNLPKHADENTLLFCVSYSGNTKETLSCFEQGLHAGCKIIIISTGGKLGEYAKNMDLPFIEIPAGMTPRDSLPLLFFPIVNCLKEVGSIGYDYARIGDFLEENKDECDSIAEGTAKKILNTIPFIYGTSESVGMRYKTQINENSKMHAKFEVYPELNHNEVAGWQGKSIGLSVIFLRRLERNEDVENAMNTLIKLIEKRAKIVEIIARGNNWLEKAFYLLYIGDLISFYLSEKQGVEREKVEFIDKLKEL